MTETHRNALPKGYALEGYHVEGVLGAGGFGITYRAREAAIDRMVAIKEYLPSGIAVRDHDTSSVQPTARRDVEDYEWGLDRFRKEAKTLVSFRHNNIIAILRYFESNNTAYLVMEYADGESLGAMLQRDGTLPEPELREFLEPLLNGLSCVHAAGFLHRDIKPDNIYVRTDGSPVLLDFGAARHALGSKSKTLTSIVSAGYAPFEQYISNSEQGAWSDIYALGAVLYRTVTGQRPAEATARVKHDDMVPASQAAAGRYSPQLLAAIDAALAVDETQRPRSVAEFARMISASEAAPSPTFLIPGAAAPPPHPAAPSTRSTAGTALSADDLGAAERRLAKHIGPLAAILVKKAAAEAVDLNDLYDRLSKKIKKRADRERFLSMTDG